MWSLQRKAKDGRRGSGCWVEVKLVNAVVKMICGPQVYNTAICMKS